MNFCMTKHLLVFIDMLNSLRHGQPDGSTSAQFEDLSRPIYYSDGLEPCELYVISYRRSIGCNQPGSFPLREQVREANEIRLHRLTGKFQTYVASDIPGCNMYNNPISMDKSKKLLDRLIAPEMIELKVLSMRSNVFLAKRRRRLAHRSC
jgi:ATP-dependent DNA helicase PIF1